MTTCHGGWMQRRGRAIAWQRRFMRREDFGLRISRIKTNEEFTQQLTCGSRDWLHIGFRVGRYRGVGEDPGETDPRSGGAAGGGAGVLRRADSGGAAGE